MRRGVLVLIALLVGQSSASMQQVPARPTLQIQKGNVLDFRNYVAVNGSVYNPDGSLKISSLKAAFSAISDVVIQGTLTISRDPQKPNDKVSAIFVVNRLEIADGGRIITNGNSLTVFANQVVARNNASIVAYQGPTAKAAAGGTQTGAGASGNTPGAQGGAGPQGLGGSAGDSGGVVTIITNTFEGPLAIELNGQAGGDGGKGGKGGAGAVGTKGSDGQCSWQFGVCVSCNQGGGGGGNGGPAGPGGPGGTAGKGGDGGNAIVAYVTSVSVSATNPKVSVAAGAGGGRGQGGDPGRPGGPGQGGSGIGLCGGGPPGNPGSPGSTGPLGATAAPAANGTREVLKLASLQKVEDTFKQAFDVQAKGGRGR
jgi:hypothetical protein